MAYRCVIVIPAYNPPASFAGYISELKKAGFQDIIVVNDGSRTDKLPVFYKVERAGALVLTHEENKGIGASLRTAMTHYQEHFSGQTDGIITLNSDRLTPVADVQKMAESLHNEQEMGSYAIVVGSRDFGSHLVTDYDYRMNVLMKLIYDLPHADGGAAGGSHVRHLRHPGSEGAALSGCPIGAVFV